MVEPHKNASSSSTPSGTNPAASERESEVVETRDALVVPCVVSIPMSEIEITYSRSSGPGGQNVNKVSSKARLRWNPNSGRLPSDVAERLKRLRPYWTTDSGELVITSQKTRDAPKNRDDCLEKLRRAILEASRKPKERIPTKPTRGSVLRRLEDKKRRSNLKQRRGQKDFD